MREREEKMVGGNPDDQACCQNNLHATSWYVFFLVKESLLILH